MNAPAQAPVGPLLVFLHKELTPEEHDDVLARVRRSVPEAYALASSRDWWAAGFPALGAAESWAWETVHGRDVLTRKPRFGGFIVVNPLNRIGARVVVLAQQHGRAVVGWDGERLFRGGQVVVDSSGVSWTLLPAETS